MKYVPLFILSVLFFQCKKNNANIIDLGKAYYPIKVANWISYSVDSISFNDFTVPASVDTNRFLLREYVESSYEDLKNEKNFRIESSKKTDSTDWTIQNIFSVKQTAFNLQKVENDLRFIKLVFPVKENTTWDGNIYLDVIDEPTLAYYNSQKFNWEYNYTQVGETLVFGGNTFQDCITVVQIDEENLFEKKYSKEVYAKNVGLVYKELIILETQAPPSSATFFERAEKGFILRYTIKDYKK